MATSQASPLPTSVSLPTIMTSHPSAPLPNYRRIVRITVPASYCSSISPLPPVDYDLADLGDEQQLQQPKMQSTDLWKRQRKVVVNIISSNEEATSEVILSRKISDLTSRILLLAIFSQFVARMSDKHND